MKKGPLFLASLFLLSSFFFILIMESALAMDVIRLDNGLTCILDKRQGTGVVAVQIWVRVGSRYEEDRVAGITHFIEHLIFKGTEKGEGYEIAPQIEALGGNINAFTSYDNTVYHIVVPKQSLETGLQLLADSVISPSFPENEIEKEKKVVIEEIKMGEDDPQRKLFKELFAASYPDHPYGRPIIGYNESVSAVTRTDILSYFREHYTPDRMTLVVVGDFEEQKVRQLIDRQLAGKAQKHVNRQRKQKERKTGKENRVRLVERNVGETYLTVAYPIHSFVHEDTPALEVLSEILGEGESSRLQSSLKHRQGLVSNAGTYLFTPQENGLFVIMANFKGRDYGKVMAGIDRELDRVSTTGVEDWEMEKAKNLVRASYIYGVETVQGKARQMGNFESLAGDPNYAEKYLKAIDRVTADDLKRVLSRYLQAKDKSVAVVLPKGSSNPYMFQLENGLRCVFNRNTASPSFSFMIGFPGGLKEEEEGRGGSFNILSRMLLRGTEEMDTQAIARKIDTLAGGIAPVSGRSVFGLSGKFLSKDFEEGLSLLKKLLTDTVIREDELKKVKAEVFSEIRQRDDEPAQYTFMETNRLLYEGHPYARDTLGTVNDVTALTQPELEKIYKSSLSPQGGVLAISGNLDQEKAEKMVRNLFSSWKGANRNLRTVPYAVTSSRVKSIDREMFQTHMTFSFIGPGIIDEDRYAVEVMNAILSGMGGRIHRKLREENPFAYAVTSYYQMAYEVGAIGIYIGTDRRHVKDVERIVRDEVEQIRTVGFTEEEVAKAKRYMIGNHYNRMQTNGSIASSMCLDTIYGLKPNFFKLWPEKAENVTKEAVNAAARKYLLPEKMSTVQVGPSGEDKK